MKQCLRVSKKVSCIPSLKLNAASLSSYFCTETPLMWEIIPAQPSGQFSFPSASYNTQQTGCVFRDAGAVTFETHLQSPVQGSSGSSLLSPPLAESFLSPAPGLSEEGRTQPSSALHFQSAHQVTIITMCFDAIIVKVDHREGFHQKDLEMCAAADE